MAKGKWDDLPLSTTKPLDCPLTGQDLLRDAQYNKGSTFSQEERVQFDLVGRLPARISTLEEQLERAYDQYSSCKDALAKNTFMTSMMEQNWVLYYKLIREHLKEMFPVIYTPTEGDAIQNFSRLFRESKGAFLSVDQVDDVHRVLSKFGSADSVDYIVVSDGEEILGIGDQGVGAILISIAKLVITTVCAGIHPARTLPVVLDCGTDNKALLEDDLYLGLKKSRVRGEQYDRLVDTFVSSARKLYPKAYIHFEDFGLANARRILDKYRSDYAIFNDDVQGTGCVTLAAIIAGSHVSGTKLADMRIVVFGAGSAGTGIADQIRDAIATESNKSKDEAAKSIWCVDKPGLLLKSMKDKLTKAQTIYAKGDDDWKEATKSDKGIDLLSVIKQVKPHVLIGTSTIPNSFTEEIIKEMASHVDRPIVFPLSNPTRLHEAQPSDINTWTDGRALIATGSPFPPVEHNGKKYEVAECNNSTCFPGIGLGCVLSRAKLLSDKMLVAACKTLAAQAPALKDPDKGLLPDVVDVWEISIRIAMAVVKQAEEEGLSQVQDIPQDEHELENWVRAQMWEPKYKTLRKV